MVRGRPPVPSGLKLLNTGRADRTREPVPPPADELEPPYELAEEAQEIWDDTVEALESMSLASSADKNQIAGYVEAVFLHRRASRGLASAVLMQAGSTGSQVINKWVQLQRDAAVLMLRFGEQFGLTPSARQRVDAEPPGAKYSGRKPNPFAG